MKFSRGRKRKTGKQEQKETFKTNGGENVAFSRKKKVEPENHLLSRVAKDSKECKGGKN